MNVKELKKAINDTGIKHYKLAADCNIHPTLLSAFLNNRRGLTDEQISALESYINKFHTIASPPPVTDTTS